MGPAALPPIVLALQVLAKAGDRECLATYCAIIASDLHELLPVMAAINNSTNFSNRFLILWRRSRNDGGYMGW